MEPKLKRMTKKQVSIRIDPKLKQKLEYGFKKSKRIRITDYYEELLERGYLDIKNEERMKRYGTRNIPRDVYRKKSYDLEINPKYVRKYKKNPHRNYRPP